MISSLLLSIFFNRISDDDEVFYLCLLEEKQKFIIYLKASFLPKHVYLFILYSAHQF